jgi:hypothetical protein
MIVFGSAMAAVAGRALGAAVGGGLSFSCFGGENAPAH